jgi:hypothetical protein
MRYRNCIVCPGQRTTENWQFKNFIIEYLNNLKEAEKYAKE